MLHASKRPRKRAKRWLSAPQSRLTIRQGGGSGGGDSGSGCGHKAIRVATSTDRERGSLGAGEGFDGAGGGVSGAEEDDRMIQEAVKRLSLVPTSVPLPLPALDRLAHKDERDLLAPARRNCVLEDGILKEKVHVQELTRRSWEKKWGFLADQEKMFRQEAEAACVDHRRPGLRRGGPPRAEHLNVLPSPPIPRLSSGLVGWRSSQAQLTLERVGALYQSPLRTIDPPSHPNDLPIGRQSFIFLG